jgi:predicted metal-dependent phosphoesterase TrpH
LKKKLIVGNNNLKQPTANGISDGSEKINRIIEVSKVMDDMEKSEEDKEKIIKILREEIKIIKHINQKIIEEKDKTIEQLKRRLKKETNFAFL